MYDLGGTVSAQIKMAKPTLTTGILAYGIESKERGGAKVYPKDLNIRYRPTPIPEHWKEVLS